jgi:hypothetical protein
VQSFIGADGGCRCVKLDPLMSFRGVPCNPLLDLLWEIDHRSLVQVSHHPIPMSRHFFHFLPPNPVMELANLHDSGTISHQVGRGLACLLHRAPRPSVSLVAYVCLRKGDTLPFIRVKIWVTEKKKKVITGTSPISCSCDLSPPGDNPHFPLGDTAAVSE